MRGNGSSLPLGRSHKNSYQIKRRLRVTTHRETKNLVFKLTPVDAYQMGLVKQICVSSNVASDDFNRPYVKLVSVSNESVIMLIPLSI